MPPRVPLLVVVWLIAGGVAVTAGPPATLRLSAAPEVVLADGESRATIRADVRDASASAVADGTTVSFQTTLGTIEVTGETRGGIAEVSLLSTTQTGEATVTAVAGAATGRVTVEFATEPAARPEEIAVVEVRGDWVGYYPTEQLVEAVGHARLSYRGLEIEAESTLLLQAQRLEVAASKATVKSGEKSIAGYYLEGRLTSTSIEGVMVQVAERVETLAFRGVDLTVYAQGVPLPAGRLRAPEPSLTTLWIRAKRALVFPQDKVAFRQAEFWSGTQKVMTLPNYIMHIGAYGATGDQFISVSSLGGIGVDLPLYYRVDRVGSGAVRVQRSRSEDWFAGHQGWSLAIEEEYRPDRNTQGRVYIDGLTKSDWGAQWWHRQSLSPNEEAYVQVGYPSHRFLYVNANLYQRQEGAVISTAANFSQAVGGPANYQVDTVARTFSRSIPGTQWMYYASGSLGVGQDALLGRHVASQGLNLAVFPQGVRLGKGTRGSFRTDYNFRWDTAGRSVTTVRARLGVDHRMGRGAQLSVGHQWEVTKGDSMRAGTHRQWNANAFWGGGSPLLGRVSATYDPESGSLSAFGDVTYQLHPRWRANLSSTYQKAFAFEQADHQVSALYRLGAQELGLRWSSLRHRFWVDVMAAQF